MNLSRTQKIVILIITILPFLLTPYIVYEIFNFVVQASQYDNYEPEPAEVFSAILSFLGPIMLVTIVSFGLLIFYIIHAAGNKAIDSTERIIWIIVFIVFGIIAFPIYWFLRIWNVTL